MPARKREATPATSPNPSADPPATVLKTEVALQIGLLVRSAAYDLEVAPRPNGADLAAARDGTVWATFHVDVDRRRPLNLLVGATVWGGARTSLPAEVAWDSPQKDVVSDFVRDRLALACKRGRAENPDHCARCPDPRHR